MVLDEGNNMNNDVYNSDIEIDHYEEDPPECEVCGYIGEFLEEYLDIWDMWCYVCTECGNYIEKEFEQEDEV